MKVFVIFFWEDNTGCSTNLGAYTSPEKALEAIPSFFEVGEHEYFRRPNSLGDMIVYTNCGQYLVETLTVQ